MATRENVGRGTNSGDATPFVELHQSFASRAAAISPFVDRLTGFIRLFMERFGMARDTEGEIELAISEALANAVIHGNHEDTNKKVDVICRYRMDGALAAANNSKRVYEAASAG